MPYQNCHQCHGNARGTVVVSAFQSRGCGHVFCHRCKITHDSNIDEISTQALSANEIAAIEDESEYRKLFVETSTIRNEANEDYGNFKWADQRELRGGVASHVIKEIQAAHALDDSFRLLDVGCGSGFTTLELADKFPHAELVGIDPSPQVKQANGYDNGRVQAIQTTLQGIELTAESFDVVVIIGNVMLHDDPIDTIRRALSVLKPNGLLIVDFKNIKSSARQICILLARLGLARFLPQGLFNRNFVNMRYGFHEKFVLSALASEPARVINRVSKPPRLLEFKNKSNYAAGWKGLLWRVLDKVDAIRGQQAWLQLTFAKETVAKS